MESSEKYFVALSPTGRLNDVILSRAAAILGKDDYTARLLLAGEMPRIIAEYKTREPAAALAGELAALGLSAIAGEESDLRQAASDSFMARSLQPGEKNAVFRDARGERLTVSRDDVFLILEGVLPASEKKEIRTEKKLNLPATLALGGIPVWSKSRVEVTPTSESEHFLRLYSCASREPVLEIRSRGFDYSFLGQKKALSSAENFKSLTGELRRIFPLAVYDNRLARNNRAGLSPAITQESLEINSRLICLFYAASRV